MTEMWPKNSRSDKDIVYIILKNPKLHPLLACEMCIHSAFGFSIKFHFIIVFSLSIINLRMQ